MKKFWMIFLICLGLLALCGCQQTEKYAGNYECVAIEGVEEDEIPSDYWLRLDARGKGAISTGLELDMKWTLDGTALTVDTEFIENTYVGTFEDYVAVLDIDGVKYTFVREEAVEAWREGLEIEATTEAPPPVYIDEAYAGRYFCTKIREEEAEIEPKGEWLALKKDGSAALHFDMEYPASWYMQDGKIVITKNNGETFAGSFEDSLLHLSGDRDYVFRKAAAGEQNVNENGENLIRVGSTWHGTLVIEEHEGEGDLKNGTYNIIAVIKKLEDGCCFEVYYSDDPERKAILSFRAALFEHYLEPVIAEDAEDAWIFEEDLSQDDLWDFTIFLSDENVLSASFDYETRNEECEMTFTFYPDE